MSGGGDSRRPRILLITDRVPGTTAGYEIRVANVVAGLMAAGDVHVCLIDSSVLGASFGIDVDCPRTIIRARELPRWRRLLQYLYKIPNLDYRDEADLRQRLRAAVGDEEWDLVWFSRARVYRLGADLLGQTHILDLDDLNDRLLTTLIADRTARLGHVKALLPNLISRPLARRWRAMYPDLATRVERLVVCHSGDRRHLGVDNVAVVPNGYPRPHAPIATRSSKSTTMLFVGPLTYEPNHLAVRWFVEEVLDRVRDEVPGARLSVVGADSGAWRSLQHEAVSFHGFVPDVAPYYEDAALALAPLQSGGGTRVKILEAMALGRPVVATPFACIGLGLEPDRDLYVARTAEEFAGACAALLTDSDRADSLVARANARFLADHQSARSSGAIADLARGVIEEADARIGPEGLS